MGADQGKLLDTTTPEGVRAMDENLQRKFSKGIQYNMKIIIRGDRNTGKTCLLKRMQGLPFTESYLPTDEIQVAHIQWTYPCTNDTVKVEIWDIVDQGRSSKSKKNAPLKFTNTSTPQDVTLDANFLDVYKGAHGIIFLYDITKQWTWQYVEKELERAPLHIPVVVVGNYHDMRDHRTITAEDAEFYVTHLNRPEGAADIRYAESCLKNGFGLRYLHKFLSIPFLQLQQEALLHQLKTNREQIMLANEGLDSKDEQDYDKFVEERNKPVAPKKQNSIEAPDTPPRQSPALPRNEPVKQDTKPVKQDTKPVKQDTKPVKEDTKPVQQDTKPVKEDTKPVKQDTKPVKQDTKPVKQDTKPVKQEQQDDDTEQQPTESSLARKFSSKLSGFLSRSKAQEPTAAPSPKSPGRPRQPTVENVDDFVPEGDLDDHFFEGGREEEERGEDSDDDTDSERTNPQVAIDEDLSSQEEEEEVVPLTIKTQPLSKPVHNKPSLKPSAVTITDSESEDDTRPTVALDEDLSSEEEPVHDDHTASLVPVKTDSPIIKQPLKSVRDVVLTDSEEEEGEGPVVMGDEDIPEPVIEPVRNKTSTSGLLLTHHSPAAVNKKPQKSKNPPDAKGLLLDFTDDSPSNVKKKKSKKSSERKSSHKKRRSKQLSVEGEEGGEEESKSVGGATISDPFDFGTSLDAWLGSDDSPSIQPRSTHGLTKTIQQSMEEEESPQQQRKTKKKHRDSEGGGGGEGKKRKSKSKKKEGPSFDNLL